MWYKLSQIETAPAPTDSYISVGHDTGQPTMMWGHDGQNLFQKEVVNDVVNGKIALTNHDSIFDNVNTFIAGGRIDPSRQIGSFSTFYAEDPRHFRSIQKAVADVLRAFPGIRITVFYNGVNHGRLTMESFASNWYVRYKIAAEEHVVPEEDLGIIREFNGIEVHVENQAGTERVGVNGEGKEWRTKMKYDYGFVCSVKGTDGDALDVYLGPDQEATNVYIVHQVDPKTGEYDEDKCMLGFDNPARAKKEYLAHYDSPKFFGTMSVISFEEFKDIVTSGDKKKVNWKKAKKVRM